MFLYCFITTMREIFLTNSECIINDSSFNKTLSLSL